MPDCGLQAACLRFAIREIGKCDSLAIVILDAPPDCECILKQRECLRIVLLPHLEVGKPLQRKRLSCQIADFLLCGKRLLVSLTPLAEPAKRSARITQIVQRVRAASYILQLAKSLERTLEHRDRTRSALPREQHSEIVQRARLTRAVLE